MDSHLYKSQLRNFLTLSLKRCMKSVAANSGSIFLLDDEKKELVLEVAQNGKGLILEGTKARLGEGIAGKVALERKPLLVKDIDNESSLWFKPRLNRYESKSFISIPLEFSGDLIGVISITDKSTGDAFGDNEIVAVLDISKYLGIAIYSLKSYLIKHRKLSEKLGEELEDLKESANQSKKFSALGKLVSGFAHEINNPLDGVIRYVNLSLDCLEQTELSKEYLLEAKKGLNRIVQFIRSILDFCWSLSSQKKRIDINRALEESLFLFNQSITSYNIKVEKLFSFNLPEIADWGLRIVFNNIIKNACQAMKDKGGNLTIVTSLEDDCVRIKFKDTGTGLSQDIQKKIFDPFFTTKDMGKGTGLGLAMSKEIIQQHNGKIYVESREGQESVFTVQLPLDSGD